MDHWRNCFNQVLYSLKNNKEQYAYSYSIQITKDKFRIVQITGWNYIYQFLNKPSSIVTNLRVKQDYIEAHRLYLDQLSLAPLPEDVYKFKIYYGPNESYGKFKMDNFP